MPPTRRTQQERVEESTTRLIQAAAELIAQGGYEAASAAEIGRRAGYSRSMVHARFGSKEQLVDAVVTSAYEGPLTVEVAETASGLDRVLARLDTTAALIAQSPELMRAIFAIEFQAAGSSSRRGTHIADWVIRLRDDTLAAVLLGQADGSIKPDLAPESTAHAIVVEGIGSAFLWTIDPTEDLPSRITQWRRRTHELLALTD